MAINGINNMRFCQQPCTVQCWKWDITEFIPSQSTQYAVLILNRPITQNIEIMTNFWNNASLRVTVDGGATQLQTFTNGLPDNMKGCMKDPDLVTGDFDSILPEVMEHFKMKGCKITHTPNPNYTDFTKALMELNTLITQKKIEIDHVIAIGQSSGRIDHTLGNIQTLFLAKEKNLLSPGTNVYIISDDSISWLLSPGNHIINIPEYVRVYKKAWCSLVPVGEPCVSVTSSGLKWNLDNQTLRFGDLVSTSNTFNGEEVVKIKCSHPILWSMRVPGLKASS